MNWLNSELLLRLCIELFEFFFLLTFFETLFLFPFFEFPGLELLPVTDSLLPVIKSLIDSDWFRLVFDLCDWMDDFEVIFEVNFELTFDSCRVSTDDLLCVASGGGGTDVGTGGAWSLTSRHSTRDEYLVLPVVVFPALKPVFNTLSSCSSMVTACNNSFEILEATWTIFSSRKSTLPCWDCSLTPCVVTCTASTSNGDLTGILYLARFKNILDPADWCRSTLVYFFIRVIWTVWS